MNQVWSFYRMDTGEFVAGFFSAPPGTNILQNTPSGCLPIEGRFNARTQKVDLATQTVIDHQPDRPSPDHEWDPAAGWVLSAAAVQAAWQKRQAQARIDELERGAMRTQRELSLDPSNRQARQRLEGVEMEIASLRPVVAQSPKGEISEQS